MKYVNQFLQLNCAEELVTLFGTYNNAIKEISESVAAWVHCVQLNDFKNVENNLHIGDGSRCSTAALFAFMHKSTNISIDPYINMKIVNKFINKFNVKGLLTSCSKYQDIKLDDAIQGLYNIILVHSHVNIYEISKHFPDWKYMYINPCCMREHQIFDFKYMKKNNIKCLKFGKDKNILSPMNEVIIYEKVKIEGNINV